MKKIGVLFAAAVALGSLSGCKKGGGDAMAKLTEIKDHMCACKDGDKDCVVKVQKEMAEYTEANKDMKEQKMSSEDVSKGTQVGMEYAKCMQKGLGAPAMTAPAPATDGSGAPPAPAMAGSGSAAPAPTPAPAPAAGSGSGSAK
jgi:hypothetical protein